MRVEEGIAGAIGAARQAAGAAPHAGQALS
jgi:hypothetical protein